MSGHKIQLCIDAVTADVADKFARESGLTTTAALQEFMKSKTYELLFNEQSFLYLESAEYVYDMLDSERCGDWTRWMEV